MVYFKLYLGDELLDDINNSIRTPGENVKRPKSNHGTGLTLQHARQEVCNTEPAFSVKMGTTVNV